MAAPLEANEVAAMGTAVDHRMDLAVMPAGDDDRRLAEEGRQVIARLRQLAGECEILPGRPEKEPAELGAIDVGIGEHPIRYPRIAFGWPLESGPLDLLHFPSSFCGFAGGEHGTPRIPCRSSPSQPRFGTPQSDHSITSSARANSISGTLIAEGPHGFQVDDQGQPRGLLHWQIRRFLTTQDLV